MSRNYYLKNRFLLPDDWAPEGTICALIPIPDDPQYLATLIGIADQLRYSANFDRDSTGTGAATVARTWARALSSQPIITVDCEGMVTMFDVRQNEEEPCILEKSEDGGETWTQWADLTLCPPTVMLGSDGKTLVYWCPTCGPGGTPGWTPLPNPEPSYDPANDDPQTPVLDWVEAGNDPACVYAANVTEGIKSIFERVGYGLLIGSLTTIIWTEVVFAMFNAKVLPKKARQIMDVLSSANSYTEAEFNGDLDTFDWQEMTDLLCCFFSDDGTVTPGDFEDGQAAMASRDSPVWNLAKSLINVVGINGLNNAATFAGITAAECDCECDPALSECWWLAGDNEYNFVAVAGKGYFTPGIGWRAELNELETGYVLDISCNVDIPAGTIDQLRVDWEPTGGGKLMRTFVDGVLKYEVEGGSAGYRSATFSVNEAIGTVRIYLEQNTLNSALSAKQICFYRS